MLILFWVSSIVVHAQVETESKQNLLFYYSGKLGVNKIECSLQLVTDKKLVSGSYMIDGNEDYFQFNGRLARDNKAFGVRVYNSESNYVGAIEAHFIAVGSNLTKKVIGHMTFAGSNERLELALVKQAEIVQNIELSEVEESQLSE